MTGFIALDPFTDIIAVHWPDDTTDITKLDFVGNKYMVRGKFQNFDQVLGDDLIGPDGHTVFRDGAEQRSWRTAAGLDLRLFDSFGLSTGARRAYLKNKTEEPNKKNPGALNEFLRHDYTIVVEWDHEDVVAALNAQSPGGYPDGQDLAYEYFTTADQVAEHYFTIGNAEKVGPTTALGLTFGSWHWDVMIHDNIFDGDRLVEDALWAPPTVELPGTVPVGYIPPEPAIGPSNQPVHSYYKPVDEHFLIYETLTNQPLTMSPYMAAYEWSGAAPPIDGRMIGAKPDVFNGSYAPFSNDTLPAPFGRMRMAMTVDNGRLIASINGSNPTIVPGLPLFARPYSVDFLGNSLGYYKVQVDSAHPFQKTFEAYFNFPGIVRCVWLYRKKKKDKALKSLSTVRPLTPPGAKNWKTT